MAKAGLKEPTDTMLLGSKTGLQEPLADIALYGNIRKVVATLEAAVPNVGCCSVACTLGRYCLPRSTTALLKGALIRQRSDWQLLGRWVTEALYSTFDQNATDSDNGAVGALLPCANLNLGLDAGTLTDFDLRASVTHAIQDRRLSRHDQPSFSPYRQLIR